MCGCQEEEHRRDQSQMTLGSQMDPGGRRKRGLPWVVHQRDPPWTTHRRVCLEQPDGQSGLAPWWILTVFWLVQEECYQIIQQQQAQENRKNLQPLRLERPSPIGFLLVWSERCRMDLVEQNRKEIRQMQARCRMDWLLELVLLAQCLSQDLELKTVHLTVREQQGQRTDHLWHREAHCQRDCLLLWARQMREGCFLQSV
jgi:hypothetical protein